MPDLEIRSARLQPAHYVGNVYVPDLILVVLEVDGQTTPELAMSPLDASEAGLALIKASVASCSARTRGRVA